MIETCTCRSQIYHNDEYTEIVVFDPWSFKTYSFKAELMIDVTMAYPSTWAGWWWGTGGWVETKQEALDTQQRVERRRQINCGVPW